MKMPNSDLVRILEMKDHLKKVIHKWILYQINVYSMNKSSKYPDIL